MDIDGDLRFSPHWSFKDLNLEDDQCLFEAFVDRVQGYYLDPASVLNNGCHGFATCAMCLVTTDYLARLAVGSGDVGPRFKTFLCRYSEAFENLDLAERLYKDFRNGLIHEGRVKSNDGHVSMISYDTTKAVEVDEQGTMKVNPTLLLKDTQTAFKRYLEELSLNKEAVEQLRGTLTKDHEADSRLAHTYR